MNNKNVRPKAGKGVRVNLGEDPRRDACREDPRGKGMATSGIEDSEVATKGT